MSCGDLEHLLMLSTSSMSRHFIVITMQGEAFIPIIIGTHQKDKMWGLDSVSLFSEATAVLGKTEHHKIQVKDKTSKSSLLYTSISTGKYSTTES